MASPSNDVYEFGPCRLDVRQRVLTREHHRVALAPKTLDLLLLFVRSPGRAFSKQELMTALWPDTFVEEANLSFQISTLRKALGDGASEWIETVPKHGYRFAADVKAHASAAQLPAASPAASVTAHGVPTPARGRQAWISAAAVVALILGAGYLLLVPPQPAQPREPASAITTPLTAYIGTESGPSLSPDGRRIAFIRGKATRMAIFGLSLLPDMAPAGEPVEVVSDPRRVMISGLAWTPDGRSLVYSSSGHLAPTRLERIPVSPSSKPEGPPELLPFGERATQISIGRTGRMVYATLLRDANFWKLDVARPGGIPEDAGLSNSTLDETAPSYSPDGKQVVFTSTRSGSEELWISSVDGTNLRQMTSMGGPQCVNGQWAPDGQSILFTSTREGSADLYLLFPGAGEVRRLTTDPADEQEAGWSRDGHWIYFGSNRTGRLEVWKMQADGSGATQVTRSGGASAQEFPDRRFLYFSKQGSPTTIWRLPLDGGDEVQLVDGLSYQVNFVVADRGIYFLAVGNLSTQTSIDFFEFSTGRRATLAKVGRPWWSGIALSPDQRGLLVATVDRDGSDLMLVDRVP